MYCDQNGFSPQWRKLQFSKQTLWAVGGYFIFEWCNRVLVSEIEELNIGNSCSYNSCQSNTHKIIRKFISKDRQTADQLRQGRERKMIFFHPKQKEIGNQPTHWLRIKGSVGNWMGSIVALVWRYKQYFKKIQKTKLDKKKEKERF